METSTKINIDNIISVYSGKLGKCCCGCSGKHTYKESTREIASKDRGFVVEDEEINDKTVKFIIKKMNNNSETYLEEYSHYCLETPTRVYLAYINPETFKN